MRTEAVAEHGRYIYAYCHIRTNQVVYSFTQTLHNASALRQLPDLGANNKDARLRKDLWKPLYTLCLPSDSPETLRQGLHAFKKLREWRTLHETSWTPSPLLSKPKTETEIEQMREKLSDRGGNRKENVYDLITREKKKLRIKSVLDQKANSVADLAAVLLAQEEMGVKTTKAREKEQQIDRAREVKEMLSLAAEAEKGGLEALEKEVASLQSRIESMNTDQPAEDGMTRSRLKKELHRTIPRKLRMEFASKAVREARPQQTESATDGSKSDMSWTTSLPSFPGPNIDRLPKRSPLRSKLRRENYPIYSTEGVTVQWNNILDAEFAATWPANVKHERMGWTRYTAPNPKAETLEDVEQFKAVQWPKREANWLPAPEGEEEGEAALERERVRSERMARKEFVGGITSDILRQVRMKNEGRREAARAESAKRQMAALEGAGQGLEQRVGA